MPASRHMRPAALLTLLAVLFWGPPRDAAARAWRVEADSTGDFASIQTAIDAAASGDTLLIGPGTWTEHLRVESKGLTLRGSAGADHTVLDGEYGGRILTVVTSGDPVMLEGLTFRRGNTNAITFPASAGGAVAAFISPLGIRDCAFRENIASLGIGGAVYATTAYLPGFTTRGDSPAREPLLAPAQPGVGLLVLDSVFEDNIAGDEGAGFFVYDTESYVSGCTFRRGDAVQGGGIGMLGGNIEVADCLFEANYAALDAGGVRYEGRGAVLLRGSEFRANRVERWGAGVRMVTGAALTVEDCAFFDGHAREGGAVHTRVAALAFVRVLFRDGRAAETGGGLTIESNAGASFERCTWIGNRAPRGASFLLGGDPITVDRSIFADSSASAADCYLSGITATCCVGAPQSGGCVAFDAVVNIVPCPSDPRGLCTVPSLPQCGTVGHAEAPCSDPGCDTPVRKVSWGDLKTRFR